MPILKWLLSGFDRAPEPPLPVALALGGGVLAAQRANGELWTWSLPTGGLLSRTRVEGARVAVSADGLRVIGGDGALRGPGGVAEPPAPGQGLFWGEAWLHVGAEALWLEPWGAPVPHPLGMPTPALRAVEGPDGLALVDPGWSGSLLIPRARGALRVLPAAQDLARIGARLALLREGAVELDGERLRPHALQTLAIAARGERLLSLGLDERDRYALHDGDPLELPGPAPEGAWLLPAGEGALLPLREGLGYAERGVLRTLALPRRRGGRPALLAPPVLVDPTHAVLPLWPPALYRLPAWTCDLVFSEKE